MENKFAVLLIHVPRLDQQFHLLSSVFHSFLNVSVAELCNQFTQCLVEKGMPAKGIAPLTKAILKARMHETQLTSIHANLLQLCLMAQNLKPALEFLNVDISEINAEVS